MSHLRALMWWVLAVLVLWASAAEAQTAVVPTQSNNTRNQEVVSAANAPVSVTLTANANTRVHLSGLTARCSGTGTAGVTVSDGGTQRWSSDAAWVNNATTPFGWIPAFSGTPGASVVVTLSACGAGSTGTLSVLAEVF